MNIKVANDFVRLLIGLLVRVVSARVDIMAIQDKPNIALIEMGKSSKPTTDDHPPPLFDWIGNYIVEYNVLFFGVSDHVVR